MILLLQIYNYYYNIIFYVKLDYNNYEVYNDAFVTLLLINNYVLQR